MEDMSNYFRQLRYLIIALLVITTLLLLCVVTMSGRRILAFLLDRVNRKLVYHTISKSKPSCASDSVSISIAGSEKAATEDSFVIDVDSAIDNENPSSDKESPSSGISDSSDDTLFVKQSLPEKLQMSELSIPENLNISKLSIPENLNISRLSIPENLNFSKLSIPENLHISELEHTTFDTSKEIVEDDVSNNNRTSKNKKDLKSRLRMSHYSIRQSCISHTDREGWNLSDIMLHQSVCTSRNEGYVAGKILKIDQVPAFQNGGPILVQLRVKVMPCKKYALKTPWVTVADNKAVFNDCYRHNLDKMLADREKQIRVRVYGSRDTDARTIQRLGECCFDIDDAEREYNGLEFWTALSWK